MEHRLCECCRVKFLLKDMKGDLCTCCYDFIEKRQNSKIADLEAKLAESESELEQEKEYSKMCLYCKERYYKELQELKQQLSESEKKFKASKDAIKFQSEEQKEWMDKYFETAIKLEKANKQLAEKEEQVKQLKLDLGMYKSVNEFINSYGIEKAREVLLQTEKTKNQDKISFAVEQFEKLKEKIICGVLDTSNGFWDFTLKKGDAYILDDALLDLLEQEFDNQIEELKKEMK